MKCVGFLQMEYNNEKTRGEKRDLLISKDIFLLHHKI